MEKNIVQIMTAPENLYVEYKNYQQKCLCLALVKENGSSKVYPMTYNKDKKQIDIINKETTLKFVY